MQGAQSSDFNARSHRQILRVVKWFPVAIIANTLQPRNPRPEFAVILFVAYTGRDTRGSLFAQHYGDTFGSEMEFPLLNTKKA